MQRPVVRSLFELIRFRNTHPAFAGDFHLLPLKTTASRWNGGVAPIGHGSRRSENNVGGDCAFNSEGEHTIRRSPPPRYRGGAVTRKNLTAIKALTFFMFMMFAMTTDSVGIIIPKSSKRSISA